MSTEQRAQDNVKSMTAAQTDFDEKLLNCEFHAELRESALKLVCAARREALTWTAEDQPLVEDPLIDLAHPMTSGDHKSYDTAMRLVGASKSKGRLVDLVTWLLHELELSKRSTEMQLFVQEERLSEKYKSELVIQQEHHCRALLELGAGITHLQGERDTLLETNEDLRKENLVGRMRIEELNEHLDYYRGGPK